MIMRGLGPIWNANETWLLVAAGTAFGAFPVVYSLVLNALFVPVMFTGVGLIIRAVAFPFYEYAKQKKLWETIFGVGSLIVAMGHGMLLGGLMSGIHIVDKKFVGGMFDFATLLTLLSTIGVVSSYVVLGYARLIQHTDFEFEHDSFSKLLAVVAITLVSLVGIFFLLPQHHLSIFTRWSEPPTSWILLAITVALFCSGSSLLYRVVKKHKTKHVYALSVLIFILSFAQVMIGIYPYSIPGAITIYEAASPAKTLSFMLYGIGPLLPIIFAYNWYLHKIFGGSWTEKTDSYSGDTEY
jgi:cytochrome d ubiquinol oxidase subunit II